MSHRRYGCLHTIARKTGGRCHLCNEKFDMETYGFSDFFGAEAATVDHLVPQSYGGSDASHNLMIAHNGCNASRGVEDVDAARYRMSGRRSAPLSTNARIGVVAGSGGLGALAGGYIFGEELPDGSTRLSPEGALVGGLTGALFALALVA